MIKTLKVVLMLTCLQGHLCLASRKLLTFASCPDCDSGLASLVSCFQVACRGWLWTFIKTYNDELS